MTTYLTIADTAIDQDSPVTETLLTSLRDNPIAIGEGSSGAPVNQTGWHPYNKVLVGDANDGLIYDFAVDGAIAVTSNYTFDAGYEYAFLFEGFGVSAGANALVEVNLSTAGWTTLTNPTLVISSTKVYWGMFRINFPRLTSIKFSGDWELPLTGTSGTLPTIGVTTIYNATAQWIAGGRVSGGGINLNAGKLYLLRRREYVTG
jgi:hypothetical protein